MNVMNIGSENEKNDWEKIWYKFKSNDLSLRSEKELKNLENGTIPCEMLSSFFDEFIDTSLFNDNSQNRLVSNS